MDLFHLNKKGGSMLAPIFFDTKNIGVQSINNYKILQIKNKGLSCLEFAQLVW